MNNRRSFAVCIGLLAASASFAASVVGTWHGKFDFSKMKPAPGANAQQQKMIEQFKTSMASTKFTIVFKANKTYSSTMMGAAVKTPTTRGGTWSQAGNVVTTKGERGTETLNMSSDGKTMVAAPKRGNGIRIIFTH